MRRQNVRPFLRLTFPNANGRVKVISRMKQVRLVVDDIQTLSRQQASDYEASLEPFSPHFHKLLSQFPSEFDRYRLDEIVVGAIVPIVCATIFGNVVSALIASLGTTITLAMEPAGGS
jgi:hypothetical protein